MADEFVLGGKLDIDLSEVEALPAELEKAISGSGAKRTNLVVGVDSGQATSQLADLQDQATTLGKTVAKPMVVIDTAPAVEALQTVADDAQKTAEKINSTKATLNVQTTGGTTGGASGGFDMQSVAGMLMMSGIGAGGALGLKSMLTSGITGAMQQGKLSGNIASMMGGGAQGQQAVAASSDLSKQTGFSVNDIDLTTATLADMSDEMGTTDDQIQTMTKRIADIARNSGLPQYADDMGAVTQALAMGIASGTGRGLKELGINISAAYMKTEFMNGALASTWDKMDAVTQAQYRYQAAMEQSASLAGTATKNSPEKSFDAAKTSIEEAGIAIGEKLLPRLSWLADKIGEMPKPLLEAGLAVGGLAMAALPLAMMGYGIKGAKGMGQAVASKVKGMFGGSSGAEDGAAVKTGGQAIATAETEAAAKISTAATTGSAEVATAEGTGAGELSATMTAGAEALAASAAERAAAEGTGGAAIEAAMADVAAEITAGGWGIAAAEGEAAAEIKTSGLASSLGGLATATVAPITAFGAIAVAAGLLGYTLLKLNDDTNKADQQTNDNLKLGVAEEAALGDLKDLQATGQVNGSMKGDYAASGDTNFATDVAQFQATNRIGSVWYNAQGQRLQQSAADYQNQRVARENAPAPGVTITIQDQTTKGVKATDVGSHASTIH